MKKNILTILCIGAFALISMSFRTQSVVGDFSGGSTITLIKGVVTVSDHHKYWEKVTFGLSGMDDAQYISYVEILDSKGGLISVEDNPDNLRSHDGVSWYKIDLYYYKISKAFYLRVHIKGGDLSPITVSKLAVATEGAPIIPEETIIIVRYP